MTAIQTEAEAYILNGHLAVTVEGRVHEAEPDVGWGGGAEIDEIYFTNGKRIPSRMWQRLTQKDFDACTDALEGNGLVRAWERRAEHAFEYAKLKREDAMLSGLERGV